MYGAACSITARRCHHDIGSCGARSVNRPGSHRAASSAAITSGLSLSRSATVAIPFGAGDSQDAFCRHDGSGPAPCGYCPHGSLAPYFAAFGAEAFHTARSVAETQPGRRLRRPFVIVADEAATIVPLPWHKITAVSSGYNIGITACVQADSQITARWGEHDAKTIRTNFTVKIIGSGFTDPGELADLSAICGDRDTWDPAGSGPGSARPERLYPPERIRLMADWHALVVHRNARPVEVKVTPVWKRRGYERVQPVLAPALPQRLAIEASREAIPMPGAQPVTPPDAVPELTQEENSWQSKPAPAAA